MSEAEYQFAKMAVYKTLVATVGQSETGKQVSQTLEESAHKAAEAARAGLERASRVKVNGVKQASPEGVRKAQDQVTEMMAKTAARAENLEVAQANIDLFRKYKADLEKYAMTGLDFIGS